MYMDVRNFILVLVVVSDENTEEMWEKPVPNLLS